MTSPIFDTLSAEREAAPVFESLTRGLDDPMWSFETMAPPSTRGAVVSDAVARGAVARQAPTREAPIRRTPTREAVGAVATWPLRTITC